MFKLKQSIKTNLLFKVTSANTIVTLVKMMFSVISQKVLAIAVGAEGLAIIGDLKSLTIIFEQFSILGTTNGLIKYIAECKANNKRLNELFSIAFIFAGLSAILSFITLLFFARPINNYVFGEQFNYVLIIKILAFVIPFMGLNVILYALLNGLSKYKLYSKVTITSIVLTSFTLIVLTLKWGLMGSLMAIIFNPILQFLSFMFFLKKKIKEYLSYNRLVFSLKFKNNLLSYGLVTLIVVISVNLTDVVIRSLIENKINIQSAGYWTAMSSISKMYMQFTAVIFPMYILPRYSQINTFKDFKIEVKEIYKRLIPLVFTGLILVFLLKNIIIKVLYTSEFYEIESFFLWQLLGDFTKLITFVLSYHFLAKKLMKYYVFIEVLSVFLFILLSNTFINYYGVKGVIIAHFVRYILYLIVVVVIMWYHFFAKNNAT